MTAEYQRFRRRHYFIKKDFQFKFILKFCLLILGGVLVSTCLLFLFSRDSLTSSFDQSRLVIEQTSFAILPALIYTNLITLGLITLATIIITLFVSHKLAGPMFRFEADLERIGEGDLTKVIRLRKKDQLKDMAETLNRMTGKLHEKVTVIHGDIIRLSEMAINLEASTELIKEIDDLRGRIETNFKL